jgi:hypothetical protein
MEGTNDLRRTISGSESRISCPMMLSSLEELHSLTEAHIEVEREIDTELRVVRSKMSPSWVRSRSQSWLRS